MKEFFRLMWRIGWKILLIIAIIWVLFLMGNFLFPKTFSFSNKETENSTQVEYVGKMGIRQKIYNYFFNSIKLTKRYEPTSEGENKENEELKDDKNKLITLGAEPEANNFFMQDASRLPKEGLYISINSNNSLAREFYFEEEKLKKEEANDLLPDINIKGEISQYYLKASQFNIYFYNEEGEYIFSIPAIASISENDENFLSFNAFYNSRVNVFDYKGNGFMVIWPNLENVESILFSKINIK